MAPRPWTANDFQKEESTMRMLLVIFLFGLSFTAAAAGTLYVQSDKAKLSAAPSFGAASIAALKKGDELAVIQAQNGWYRVRTDGKTGWIPRLLVSQHKPIRRISVISGEKDSVKTSARRRASNVTTAGAARGLVNDDRRRANPNGAADYEAVQSMESETIPQKDVEAFGKTLGQ
jgi:uncharacterized protein YgiM (DUF1202 family)